MLKSSGRLAACCSPACLMSACSSMAAWARSAPTAPSRVRWMAAMVAVAGLSTTSRPELETGNPEGSFTSPSPAKLSAVLSL